MLAFTERASILSGVNNPNPCNYAFSYRYDERNDGMVSCWESALANCSIAKSGALVSLKVVALLVWYDAALFFAAPSPIK